MEQSCIVFIYLQHYCHVFSQTTPSTFIISQQQQGAASHSANTSDILTTVDFLLVNLKQSVGFPL